LTGLPAIILGIPVGIFLLTSLDGVYLISLPFKISIEEKKYCKIINVEVYMNIFVCKVCGHIEFGISPDKCPVCSAVKNKFENNNNVFNDVEKKYKEKFTKHVPIIKLFEKNSLIPDKKYTAILVQIGEKRHPMKENHYIRFIDCYLDDKYISRIMLTPFMKSSVVFYLVSNGSKLTIVESCNIHGHWMKKAKL
jgi:desulfoferrodoxin-like iron-binding protein